MNEIAHLANGQTAEVAERCYLTRDSGETVFYAVRTTAGRVIAAAEIAYVL
jgi:hypothetical protein